MTTGSPHSFAIATDSRIPARHLVSRVRGSAADWQPHGVGHAVARDTKSGLCQNTTLCGVSVYNLHLFAELAFVRGAPTCPDCYDDLHLAVAIRDRPSPALRNARDRQRHGEGMAGSSRRA